jgi:hypothetical protein
MGCVTIWAIFFTSSSGHPEGKTRKIIRKVDENSASCVTVNGQLLTELEN